MSKGLNKEQIHAIMAQAEGKREITMDTEEIIVTDVVESNESTGNVESSMESENEGHSEMDKLFENSEVVGSDPNLIENMIKEPCDNVDLESNNEAEIYSIDEQYEGNIEVDADNGCDNETAAVDDDSEESHKEPEEQLGEENKGEPDNSNSSKGEPSYESQRAEAIMDLNNAGIKIDDNTTGVVQIAESLDGISRLFLRAIKPRKSCLKYQIYEEINGISDYLENKDGIIKPNQILNSEHIVKSIIQNMTGYYEDDIDAIYPNITNIVKFRLLVPETADSDFVNPEMVVEELKHWFEDHMNDLRVGIFIMQNQIHVAFVKRGQKTPYQIFREVLGEIAPANQPSKLKDWLFNHNYLEHDGNEVCRDCQKTISQYVMEEIGAVGDKCISFKFDAKYRRELYEAYLYQKGILILNEDFECEEAV